MGIIGSLCEKYSDIGVLNDPVKLGLIEYNTSGTNKRQFGISKDDINVYLLIGEN